MSSEPGSMTSRSHWTTPALDRPVHAWERSKELPPCCCLHHLTEGVLLDIGKHRHVTSAWPGSSKSSPGQSSCGHFWTRGGERFSESYSLWNRKWTWNWEWPWTLATETKDYSDALESNCPIMTLFVPFYWLTSLHQLHGQLENVHKMRSS